MILCSLLSIGLKANPEIDSLQRVINMAPDDSANVENILLLSRMYYNVDPSMAIEVARKALDLAERIEYPSGVAYSYKSIGIAHYFQGQNVEAVTAWQQALEVFESINDQVGVANMLSNIGAIYYNEGDYSKALEYHLQSLKVAEGVGDTLRIFTALTNIGAVYSDNPATHDKALEYSMRALALSEIMGDKDAIATTSVNIGGIYLTRGEDSLALVYFEKSLDNMETSDGVIYTLVAISQVYLHRGDHNMAVDYLMQAIDLADQLNAIPNKAHALVYLGEVYRDHGDYDLAIRYYKEGAQISRDIKSLKDLELAYGGLDAIYKIQLQYDSAYKYHDLLMVVKDSVYNIEMDKILQNQMFDFQIEKKEGEIDHLKREQELQERDLRRQKTIRNLVLAGFFSVIVFLLIVFKQKQRITMERNRSEELLLNILPYEVAEELKDKGSSEAKDYNDVTVLFTDFKGFTGHSEKLTAKELVDEINDYFKAFDQIITKYKVEKIKTIGDAYMAAGGVPVPYAESLVNVVLCGMEMQEYVEKRKDEFSIADMKPFSMRVGINTGPVVAGIVGVKKFQYDIWGDTVNTASRMESNGDVGKVNISERTYEKLKDNPMFQFTKREKIEVKGKGTMQMYFVELAEGYSLNDFARS
jgi:class 3 adenylate cyclase/Tfp pilus assembly protein PilF